MRLNTQPGDNITNTCAHAIALAIDRGCAVGFTFNGCEVTATAESTADELVAQYHNALNEASAKYRASDEYKAMVAAQAAKERARARALLDALAAAPERMTLKDPDGWRKAREANTDAYGSAALRYAETWARVMESEITRGAKVADIAERCSHLADTEGITGFMHHCARATLVRVWAYGDELRQSVA